MEPTIWRKRGVKSCKGKILVKTPFGVMIGYYRPKKVVEGVTFGEGLDTDKGSFYCPVKEWLPVTTVVPDGVNLINVKYIDFAGVKLTDEQLEELTR